MHKTKFISTYGTNMVTGHSDNERKKPVAVTLWASLFNQQKRIFYMHHPTVTILVHTTTFVTPVVEHWLKQKKA